MELQGYLQTGLLKFYLPPRSTRAVIVNPDVVSQFAYVLDRT